MEVPQPPRCECTRLAICKRSYTNGALHVVEQCQDCGRQVRSVGREICIRQGIWPSRLPSWNQEITDRWRAQQKAFWDARNTAYHQEREDQNREWWERYEAHMQSLKWASLRVAVFERCSYRCEGCGKNRAVQVHHLTYARLGDEMLFDLVAVCLGCHERIHQRPTTGTANARSHS